MGRNVFHGDGSGPNDREIANHDARPDEGVSADPGASAY